MHIYILKRLLALIPTLLGITVLVFFMVHLVPGDPAQIMLGERASAESLAALRRDPGPGSAITCAIWTLFIRPATRRPGSVD